ncbi:Fur family transcriptional regulator [Burkholderia sp. 22PA0099]|uniref:Fur family transcriptional regulator n=1 Tax=Burkholderia sp. 22PA0099 TaxID=3237372 RepID=UPI0039C16B66
MSLTRKQQLVLDALRRAGAPLGAYALLDRLREAGFNAPAQVYRALARLVEAGEVSRLETLNAYLPRTAVRGDAVSVFTICERCSRIGEYADASLGEYADASLGERLAHLTGRHDFVPSHAAIEIRGRCVDCTADAD